MAIAKVIYKTSAEDSGTVWMDTTQKTVTAGTMLSGTTALKNDGTDVTGNIASKSSSDLTANNLTVTAPAGYYASAASKTLSDENLTAGNIKKDVTIFGTTGSYEGGSATLITKSITANGTYNASSDNADGYSSVTVNVSGGGGVEYETGTYTPTENIASPTINFVGTHQTAPSVAIMVDQSSTSLQNSDVTANFVFMLMNAYLLFGLNIPVNTGNIGKVSYAIRSTSGTITQQGTLLSTTNASTFVSNTYIKPYTNSATRYWMAGRTYKWIAIWGTTT